VPAKIVDAAAHSMTEELTAIVGHEAPPSALGKLCLVYKGGFFELRRVG